MTALPTVLDRLEREIAKALQDIRDCVIRDENNPEEIHRLRSLLFQKVMERDLWVSNR